jgi:hypothetical protein
MPLKRAKLRAVAWAEETIVANLDKASGKHMLQEAAQELVSGQCAVPAFARLRIGVAESHLIVFKVDQAAIAERDAEYV